MAGWKSHLQELKPWSNRQAQHYVRLAIKRDSLVPAEKRYTTYKALAREKVIFVIEAAECGAVAPFMKANAIQPPFGTALNAGQRSAVEIILLSKNRFIGIQGDAGTAKTDTLNHAVELIRQACGAGANYRIVTLAPYGNQVRHRRTKSSMPTRWPAFLDQEQAHRRKSDDGPSQIEYLQKMRRAATTVL